MADDLELSFVQIGMNETVPRRIIDRHQPELAVGITSQNDSQSLLEVTGKYFSQISSPTVGVASAGRKERGCVGVSLTTARRPRSLKIGRRSSSSVLTAAQCKFIAH